MTEATSAPTTSRIPLPKKGHVAYMMGCDPEFFFKVKKKVVGAEFFLPKEGFKPLALSGLTKFVIDGVQAEMNPRPNNCRANLANEIKTAFTSLKVEVEKKNAEVVMDFSRSVKISKTELLKLDPNNQRFGCMPSKNAYADEESKLHMVDPLKYLTRSAGGHIHIGISSYTNEFKDKLAKEPDEIVQMLDIICGNTCVLIDREKGNRARRRLYGRAGEYRLPVHGLEYRTLSNFWLTNSALMSLAFGLTRLAINLASDAKNGKRYCEEFKSKVDMKDIRKAINNNDFKLAYKNFKAIEPLLMEVIVDNSLDTGINPQNIKEFHHFVQTVKENGLSFWFKDDPLTHWTTNKEGHTAGFGDFLYTVRAKMKEESAKATAIVVG